MARPPRHAVGAAALPRLVALLCLVAALAACTVGPSQRPPVAVRGENVPAAPGVPGPTADPVLPEPEPQRASIPFFECTEDTLVTLVEPVPADRHLQVDCGDLTVPADPDQPSLGAVTLGVIRVGEAGAPADRPPLLVLGDSTREPSTRHAAILAGQVDPALLQRYTLVGLDRRGAGEDILHCAPDIARSALVDADTESAGEADLALLLERARAVVQECNLTLDGGLGSYRTAASASDVELLRAALGVERLSAVGVGDGAAALAMWARSAPRSVGRLVLDGPPHPTQDEPDLTDSRAAAAEAALGAFGVACSARPDCPLGPDPRATVAALLGRLERQPLVTTDGSRLTAGATVTALLSGLGEPRRWPGLTAALAAANAGDPVPMLTILAPITGPRGLYDGMLATTCNDTQRRLAPGEVEEVAQRWTAAYPTFGATFALRLLACAPWPTGREGPLTGQAEAAPPILVIGTAADPRGALDGSRRTADSLATARFISWQGAGTGAYPRTPCISGVVDSMLLDGVMPDSGTLCPP
ncbi:alpha/beta hydrolase [Pseudonocardia sp. DSM 110487]|uniref:alpha/beta fold hydrolase n=1 Tax=Pseudonocardia sp. DSM 110487 TaxID=2865833 RepID=UPI001C6A421B|nr:alpha/beta fold hydrolase [Pseudonocardia sp. DSM 110487]QYN38228.1 alpha/beta hydrolase [Pseudonocardia sp. DSM 110487]